MRNGLTVAWVTAVAAAAGSAAEKQAACAAWAAAPGRVGIANPLYMLENCRASCADVTATAAPPADAAMEAAAAAVDADGAARQVPEPGRATVDA